MKNEPISFVRKLHHWKATNTHRTYIHSYTYLLAIPRNPPIRNAKTNPFTPFCGHYYLSPGYKCAVSFTRRKLSVRIFGVCDFYDHVHCAHPPDNISSLKYFITSRRFGYCKCLFISKAIFIFVMAEWRIKMVAPRRAS